MIERAEERRRATGQPTIFFLDEIHRFNKAQQDALLPAVEEGLRDPDRGDHREPLLRGQLGAALAAARSTSCAPLEPRSRCASCSARARRPRARDRRPAARSTTRRSSCSPTRAGGDARTALGGARAGGRDGARRRRRRSTSATAEDALQRKAVDLRPRRATATTTTSRRWIKATRGSDPDAALYYLAVMLEGGEDPRFIARRMVILASEDIGNADPQALLGRRPPPPRPSTGSACPSARSTSPRRPSTSRWRRSRTPPTTAIARGHAPTSASTARKLPPDYLRDAHYPGAKKLGRGEGYVYPHDEPGGVADQPLLPPEVARASASTSPPTAASRPSSGAASTDPRSRPSSQS